MLDNFFLTYANQLFKDDSDNFKRVIQAFITETFNNENYNFYHVNDKINFDRIFKNICSFSEYSDFKLAFKTKEELKAQTEIEYEKSGDYGIKEALKHIDLAFEAVFFYKTGWCDGTWQEDGSCIGCVKAFQFPELKNNVRLKCYECYQLFYRHMLVNFVQNEGFRTIDLMKPNENPYPTLISNSWLKENNPGAKSAIVLDSSQPGFHFYVDKAYDCIDVEAIAINNEIKKYEHFSLGNLLDDEISIYPLYTRFNDFFISVVSYSLLEFLRNNDFKKLKLCPYCDEFFIAKSISRKTRCYKSSCEKAYQRDKKRKQREIDPVKYQY